MAHTGAPARIPLPIVEQQAITRPSVGKNHTPSASQTLLTPPSRRAVVLANAG